MNETKNFTEKELEEKTLSLAPNAPTAKLSPKRSKKIWVNLGIITFSFLILNLAVLLLEPLLFAICMTQGFHTAEKISLYLDSDYTPDVIFLGSSRVPTGLNPTVAEQVLSQNNLKMRVLNLGVVASGLDLNYRILKNIIQKNKKPRVIVYGLSEFDLLGLIPGNNKYDSISRVPYANYLLRLDDFGSYSGDTLEKKADFILNQLVPLYRDQKLIFDAIKTQFKLDSNQIILGKPLASGYIPMASQPFTQDQIAQEDVGYRSIIPTYNPDNPYLDDFKKLANLAKSRGIELIVVNMPVSLQFQSYWQSDTKLAKYTQLVDRLGVESNVPVLNLYQSPEDLFPSESFWDTNHLSTIGAEILTRKLTQEYLVPYFKSTLDPAEFYRADIENLTLSANLNPGTRVTGAVKVKNNSTVTWPVTGNTSVRLGYHWLDEQGQPIVKEGLRTQFDQPLKPGSAATLDFKLETPPTSGTYTLEIDLVYEGVGWFGANGSPTLRKLVKVGTNNNK